VEIKTTVAINGFIATDPKLTISDDGQARFYARVGINHYQRHVDGGFTKLDPTYHDLIQFGKAAEISAERFRKGDEFLAQGYQRDYTRRVGGQTRSDQQFVAKRLAHDPNTTRYTVQRTAPADGRDTASREPTSHDSATRPVTTQPAESRADRLPPPSPATAAEPDRAAGITR
jgi:single-strand DNA-binding protein